eukprot:4508817-Amphidinium_carterae.1
MGSSSTDFPCTPDVSMAPAPQRITPQRVVGQVHTEPGVFQALLERVWACWAQCSIVTGVAATAIGEPSQ